MQGAIERHASPAAPGGAIVNILSMNAHCGTSELAVYSASKGALATLTKNAAHAHLADAHPGQRHHDGLGRHAGRAGDAGRDPRQGPGLGGARRRGDAARPDAGRAPRWRGCVIWLLSPQAGMQTGTLIDLEQAVVGAPTPRAVAP